LLVGLILFEALAWMPGTKFPTGAVFLAAPAAALFLLGLWSVQLDAQLGPCRGLCVFLGRLAYPIFLLHWPVGLLVYHWSGAWHDWQMFAGSALVSMSGGSLIVLLLEMPMEKWRAQIRRRPVSTIDLPPAFEAVG
jgi:peptidoglycan/LPS O-acetylase OafA/YrhL